MPNKSIPNVSLSAALRGDDVQDDRWCSGAT